MESQITDIDRSKYDFRTKEKLAVKFEEGLSEKTVREISEYKKEPAWMLELRLKAFQEFLRRPVPTWGADLSGINFDEIAYYAKPNVERKARSWDEVPQEIKETFEKLGVPEAERKYLAGSIGQFKSEAVYYNLKKEWEEKGVVFTDMDTALKEYGEVVKKHFMRTVPYTDNKLAALHYSMWSGGSFLYVPKNVKIEQPFQNYFRMNSGKEGMFEHTLIIIEDGARARYLEGCFTKGTKITTKTGEKAIEDITRGDKVLTHKNRYKKVYHTQIRPYSGKLHRIRYYGDSKTLVEATSEHPFLAVKRERMEYKNTKWKPKWTRADELLVHDYLAMPIEKSLETREFREFTVEFKGRETTVVLKTDTDFFRLVGYYLAEGTTLSKGHYLSFTFNVKEREYIDDVKQLLKKQFGKEPLEYADHENGVSLILCSTLAARVFKKNFGNSAYTKCLPEWALKETHEKQKELIKGYWRGDGSILNKRFNTGLKTVFRMNTISRKLAYQVRDILLRLGIFGGINVWKKKPPRKESYVIHVGGDFLLKFASVVSYKGQLGERTREGQQILIKRVSLFHMTEDYAFVPIKAIETELVENMPTYNFGVETDESYIANGVAVHNCSAPRYEEASVHSAVIEIFVGENADAGYTSVQNWSKNIFNMNTKRAIVQKNSKMQWIDGSLGSKVTMLYPMSILKGEGASTSNYNMTFSSEGSWKDTGAKVVHAAPYTTSKVVAKSISMNGGIAAYRGLLRINPGAKYAKSHVQCDALILDDISRTDTYPHNEIYETTASFGHEASVGRISDDQVFYLMNRGLKESEAKSMIVLGFLDEVLKEIPFEYAVEFNRLVKLEFSKLGAVG